MTPDIRDSMTGEEIDALEEPRTRRCPICNAVYPYNAVHECDGEGVE
jgi:hypothetical protein